MVLPKVSVSMGILSAVLDIKGGPHLALPGDAVFLLMFCDLDGTIF